MAMKFSMKYPTKYHSFYLELIVSSLYIHPIDPLYTYNSNTDYPIYFDKKSINYPFIHLSISQFIH